MGDVAHQWIGWTVIGSCGSIGACKEASIVLSRKTDNIWLTGCDLIAWSPGSDLKRHASCFAYSLPW